MAHESNSAVQKINRLLMASSRETVSSASPLSSEGRIVFEEAQAGAGLACPPPASAAHFANCAAVATSRIGQAIAFAEIQAGLLKKFRVALEQMQGLAAQFREDGQFDCALRQNEYRQLTAFLRHLAHQDLNGTRLFDKGTLSIDLDAAGNKLIMAGTDLASGPFACVLEAPLSTPDEANELLGHLEAALTRLSAWQKVVAANLNYLHYLGTTLT